MPDPRFAKSVILMLRHGPDGAMGLIVNKTLVKAPLSAFFDQLEPVDKSAERKFFIRNGGPVGRRQAFVIHRRDYAGDGTMVIQNGYAMTSSAEILEALRRGEGPKQHVIVFGYAGWGAGQLEAEVERRDWYWAPVEESLIFDSDDRGKWKRALKNSGLDL